MLLSLFHLISILILAFVRSPIKSHSILRHAMRATELTWNYLIYSLGFKNKYFVGKRVCGFWVSSFPNVRWYHQFS